MKEWITATLMFLGATLMLLAALGITRMPDLYSRMQAATKAGILGVGFMLLAVAVHFGEIGVTTQALLVVAFFFLTSPVAAHIIARAAYLSKVPLWEGTVWDELRGQYDPRTHALESSPGKVPEGESPQPPPTEPEA